MREIAHPTVTGEQSAIKSVRPKSAWTNFPKNISPKFGNAEGGRSRLLREAKAEARQITAEANKQIENTIRVIRESQADKEKTLEVRRKMEEFKETLEQDSAGDEAIDRKIEQIRRREHAVPNAATASRRPGVRRLAAPKSPWIVEPGVKVRIKGQDAVGEVVSVSGKRPPSVSGKSDDSRRRAAGTHLECRI